MRLTKYDREAFVSAVLDDVPKVDYQEQARVAVQKWAVDHLPAKLKPLHKEFGHFFNTDCLFRLPGNIQSIFVVTANGRETLQAMKDDTKFWATLEDLAKALDAQSKKLVELNAKVTGLINSCTTVKQVEERAPEFVKYLGKSTEQPNKQLPVVQNVVADLVAAGWPKDKKKTSTRRAA